MDIKEELDYIYGAIEDWGTWNKRSGTLSAPSGIVQRIEAESNATVNPLLAALIEEMGAGFFTGKVITLEYDGDTRTLETLLGEENTNLGHGGPECIIWTLMARDIPHGFIPFMSFSNGSYAVSDQSGRVFIWDTSVYEGNGLSRVTDSLREFFYMLEPFDGD